MSILDPVLKGRDGVENIDSQTHHHVTWPVPRRGSTALPGIKDRRMCPPPGALPDPGIESRSPMSPALAGGFFTTSATWV